MRFIALSIFILFSEILLSQILLTEHCVFDNNNKPIPFATILFKNSQTGTTTNESGCFKLPISKTRKNDTIVIKHLSFLEREISVSELLTAQTITLEESTIELLGATKVGYKAETIVKKAIQQIRSNYQPKTDRYNALYRQVHLENGKYVRLIDAQIVLEDVGYANRKTEKFLDGIHITELRKSLVYERNGEEHGDHLVDLLLANPVKYQHLNLLNTSHLSLYDFSLTTYENKLPNRVENEDYYYIHFQNKPWHNEKNFKGNLIIHKETFFIQEISFYTFPNQEEEKSNWLFLNGYDKFIYKDGRIDKALKQYNHYVMNEQTKSVQYIVEEQFELFVLDTKLDEYNYAFGKQSNLYRSVLPYNKNAWNKLDQIYPLPKKLLEELSKYKPLEEQFKKT